jgi:hypothetical protein
MTMYSITHSGAQGAFSPRFWARELKHTKSDRVPRDRLLKSDTSRAFLHQGQMAVRSSSLALPSHVWRHMVVVAQFIDPGQTRIIAEGETPTVRVVVSGRGCVVLC